MSYKNELKNLLNSWFTKYNYQKKEDHFYIDLHTHFLPLKFYKKGINTLVEEAMKRVDVMIIGERGVDKENILNYEDFKNALKSSNYEYRDMGRVVEIRKNDNLLYVLSGCEITTKQNLHLLTIGSNKRFYNRQDITEAINLAREDNRITILPHPFTVNAPVILGRTINKKESEIVLEKCKEVDALEIFNCANNLWLSKNNTRAKEFVEQNSLTGIAASDTHGDPKQLGLSGILVKKEKLITESEEKFISSLKEVLKNKDFRTCTDYNNPIIFLKRMAWPQLRSIRSLKEVANLMLFLLMNKPKYKKDGINAGH